MKSRKAASLALLVLLIGAGGCGSESSLKGSSTSVPGISISPISAIAGSSDLVLTVTGSNFADALHNTSVVVWSTNGGDTFLATTFDSSIQLTAVIPAALLANPVTAGVLVETGDVLDTGPLSKSKSITFNVTTTSSGSISISAISPMSAVAGSPELTLTVTGSNFVNAPHNKSLVFWIVNNSGFFLDTTFDSSTQLTAVIPAALLANPVRAHVEVGTGDPLGSEDLSDFKLNQFYRHTPIASRQETAQVSNLFCPIVSCARGGVLRLR